MSEATSAAAAAAAAERAERAERAARAEAARASIDAAIDDHWDAARAHWARSLQLGRPVVELEGPAIARIDLRDRQVFVSAAHVAGHGLETCLEAILAHEVGHHVKFPRSLGTLARMRILEKQLIPLEHFSALNLFTDLLINEHLGRRGLQTQLGRVYGSADHTAQTPATFLFTLAIYEELWQLPPASLVGPEGHEKLHGIYDGYRAEAHLVAQDLYRLGPNVFTQLIFYLSVLSRYLIQEVEENQHDHGGHSCQCAGEPDADDWASALTPGALEDEAIERAAREGWLAPDQIRRLRDKSLGARAAGLPGNLDGTGDQVTEIMANWYRRQAERYLLRPPPQRRLGEAIVPTTHEAWEPGDPIGTIDWGATLRERGPRFGAARPVRRETVADHEGLEVELWQPRSEIYLDVSGSMPDPREAENAMTLAAIILALGTLRAGGAARALLYSHTYTKSWRWCRSLRELSGFMLKYVGGGTEFPFDVLSESVEACRDKQPIRLVLTDRDFDFNVGKQPDAESVLRHASEAGPGFILVQAMADPMNVKQYRSWGMRVVDVPRLNDFPAVAAQLAHALFPEEGRPTP